MLLMPMPPRREPYAALRNCVSALCMASSELEGFSEGTMCRSMMFISAKLSGTWGGPCWAFSTKPIEPEPNGESSSCASCALMPFGRGQHVNLHRPELARDVKIFLDALTHQPDHRFLAFVPRHYERQVVPTGIERRRQVDARLWHVVQRREHRSDRRPLNHPVVGRTAA